MHYWLLSLLLVAIPACTPPSSNSDVNPAPSGTPNATLSGTVTLGSSVISQKARPSLEGIAYVSGEAIVRFKAGISLQSVQVQGVSLQAVRPLAIPQTYLFRAKGNISVPQMLQSLRARPDVLWAQPNHIYHRTSIPTDPLYNRQWDLPAMNLPAAWDIETGSGNPVTVAVVDTGIAPNHPEFSGRILQGYDFVSTSAAGDGNARDPDPTDPGGAEDGYHGSHVTGTIAANANNGLGIAGISWGAKILPVRALGVGGTGTTSDIVDAITWAAGITVLGAPTNTNPAQVMNLSLGIDLAGACDPAEQTAFDEVRSTGTIVVVAAGNTSSEAARFAPGNCAGIITVGATDYLGQRARYSNHGSRVDVMAPGGDIRQKFTVQGVTYAASILSTVLNAQGTPDYDVYNGTSMAAPHVTGLIALMKSLKPSLSLADALYVLRKTSRPLSDSQCKGSTEPTLTGADCGAGLVDAAAALNLLKTLNVAPFALYTEPTRLRLSPQTTASLVISFSGDSPISLTVVGVPSGVSVSFTNTVMAAKSQLNLTLTGSVPKGDYRLKIVGTKGSVSYERPILLRVGNATPSLEQTLVLACYRIRESDGSVGCDPSASGAQETDSNGNFLFTQLYRGMYDVLAWQDATEDDQIDDGDYAALLQKVQADSQNLSLPLQVLTP